MQGYPGAFTNVVIDSNRVIRQTDPNLPFPTGLQGIDAFDGDWTNLAVTNNVVVTSSCWGIAYASVHGGKIINNTVLADGLVPTAGNCKPIVGWRQNPSRLAIQRRGHPQQHRQRVQHL